MPATLAVYGNINSIISADATSVANSMSDSIAHGTLVQSESNAVGMNVPVQIATVEGGSSSSSSSSSLSDGTIAGIVIGTVLGALVLAGIGFYLFLMNCSSKAREVGSSQLEEESSHADALEDNDHASEEMEMQTV